MEYREVPIKSIVKNEGNATITLRRKPGGK